MEILTTRELRQRAMTKRQLRTAVRTGRLTRIRRGWYATSDPCSHADQQTLQAVRRGGCLSCVSVLAQYGVHVPDETSAHMRLPRGTIARSCRPYGTNRHRVDAPMDSVEVALACAVRCLDGEDLLACLDTSLSLGLVHESQIRTLLRLAPPRKRALLHLIGRVDSGQESILKYRLAQLRILFAMHQRVGGVGVVDFLIGLSLIIELDGREYHSDAKAFERDRVRDAEALRAGYLVLRFTWRQLMFEWEDVKRRILEIVRSDGHRRRRRTFSDAPATARRSARSAPATRAVPKRIRSTRASHHPESPSRSLPAGLLATWSVLTHLGTALDERRAVWHPACSRT